MQTQVEDISADDSLGEEQITTEKELEKQFLHPGYTFKGQKLKPYTAGTDLLFNQVLDQNDAPDGRFTAQQVEDDHAAGAGADLEDGGHGQRPASRAA